MKNSFGSRNFIALIIHYQLNHLKNIRYRNHWLCFLLFFFFSFYPTVASAHWHSSKSYYLLGYPPHSKNALPPGLFSAFRFVLGALHIYEERIDQSAGLEIDFAEEGLYYDPLYGKNSWEYYCEPIRLGFPQGAEIKGWYELHGEWIDSQIVESLNKFHNSRERNHAILYKYVRVKPHIIRKLNEIRNKQFKGFMIGIHYRGTDKIKEAYAVSYETVYKAIINLITEYKLEDYRIFVATDEFAFLDFMKKVFPNHVVCYEEAYRSDDGQPLHFNKCLSPYKTGEDAFIDCLLLANCNYLIATSSHLSICSTFFNLNLPFLLLNSYYP